MTNTKRTKPKAQTPASSASPDAGLPSIFWDALSLEAINRLLAQGEAVKLRRHEEAKAQLRAEFAAKAQSQGMTLEEVMGITAAPSPRGRRKASATLPAGEGQKPKVSIKYRGPGGETWSGRGMARRWLKALEQAGQSREQFAV
jgi:DNA-binding protein H-NS